MLIYFLTVSAMSPPASRPCLTAPASCLPHNKLYPETEKPNKPSLPVCASSQVFGYSSEKVTSVLGPVCLHMGHKD